MSGDQEYGAVRPEEIEAQSFAIIDAELEAMGICLDQENGPVIRRAIHTTADFDYARNLVFSPGAVRRGIEALEAGAVIVTDTNMARAGINKKKAERLGVRVYCFMADEDVAREASERGCTRASVSMEKSAALFGAGTPGERPVIYAIGNAPTALHTLCGLIDRGRIRPALIIGVPVGFVHVVSSKEELIRRKDVPGIIARGRKGGSNVAAAIVNAMLYQAGKDKEEGRC